MKQITDEEFLQELKRGPLGRDLAAIREAERLATAKKLAKERAAALTDFDAAFPALEQAEENALAAFREASEKLEQVRQEAHAAHVARTSLQREVGERIGEINGKISRVMNPLARELYLKLEQITEDARKIRLIQEERRDAPPSMVPTISKRKDVEVFTNRAARDARNFFPQRIANALAELVLAGCDSDANLNTVFNAGVAALPHENTLRLEDDAPSRFSPHFEAAVEKFSEAVDLALASALKEAINDE